MFFYFHIDSAVFFGSGRVMTYEHINFFCPMEVSGKKPLFEKLVFLKFLSNSSRTLSAGKLGAGLLKAKSSGPVKLSVVKYFLKNVQFCNNFRTSREVPAVIRQKFFDKVVTTAFWFSKKKFFDEKHTFWRKTLRMREKTKF